MKEVNIRNRITFSPKRQVTFFQAKTTSSEENYLYFRIFYIPQPSHSEHFFNNILKQRGHLIAD